jgi:hypothetical protein
MTHTTLFTTADISKIPINALNFPADPRSQRAQAGARYELPTDNNVTKLTHETLVQIVSLENISTSKTAQLDELLALNDIESVGADRQRYAGQRIVRDVDVENDEQQTINVPNTNISQFFKLTVQDTKGNLRYAIELEKLPFLSSKNLNSGFPIQLGSKLLLKNSCESEQGVLLLTRTSVEFLGGLVPEWNQKLNERHIALLKDQLNQVEA